MKERIFSRWSFQRWAYFIMGLILTMSSILDQFWAGILFGLYFAAMGLFGFGCASGNCNTPREEIQKLKNE